MVVALLNLPTMLVNYETTFMSYSKVVAAGALPTALSIALPLLGVPIEGPPKGTVPCYEGNPPERTPSPVA